MRAASAHRRARWRKRIRDLLICCAIGVGIVASLLLYANYQFVHHRPPGLPLKWLGFAILTALVFGNEVRFAPQRWRSLRFWLGWSSFLTVHFAIGILILLRITKIGMLQFFLVLPVEYLILDRLLDYVMKPEERA